MYRFITDDLWDEINNKITYEKGVKVKIISCIRDEEYDSGIKVMIEFNKKIDFLDASVLTNVNPNI